MSTARMQKCCTHDSDQNRQEQEEASALSFLPPAVLHMPPTETVYPEQLTKQGCSTVGPSPSIAEQSTAGRPADSSLITGTWGESETPLSSATDVFCPDSPLV